MRPKSQATIINTGLSVGYGRKQRHITADLSLHNIAQVSRFLMQVTTDNISLTGMKFFSVTRSLVLTVSMSRECASMKVKCSPCRNIIWLVSTNRSYFLVRKLFLFLRFVSFIGLHPRGKVSENTLAHLTQRVVRVDSVARRRTCKRVGSILGDNCVKHCLTSLDC